MGMSMGVESTYSAMRYTSSYVFDSDTQNVYLDDITSNPNNLELPFTIILVIKNMLLEYQ